LLRVADEHMDYVLLPHPTRHIQRNGDELAGNARRSMGGYKRRAVPPVAIPTKLPL